MNRPISETAIGGHALGTAAAVPLAILDKDAILKFIEKTRKLVFVHEDIKTCGFGGEVSAIVAEEGLLFWVLPSNGLRLPMPLILFSPALKTPSCRMRKKS
jgi:pyruvate dehydrogenase E1 component beta subunit